MLQRIAQLRAGSAERPAAGRRARLGGEQEPAPPLHQHNCLGSAAQPAGLAPPTSCDQIRPEKASSNLGRLSGLGISSRPTSTPEWVALLPQPRPAPPMALLEPTGHAARSFHTKVRRRR